jgi:hypothetical protein
MLQRSRLARPLFVGLVITAIQTLCVCAVSEAPTLAESYRSLYRWDAEWYGNIVAEGYHSRIPPIKDDFGHSCNVAFFPGFPLLAGALHYGLGLPIPHAVLLASQVACWGFWTYLLLLLADWGVPVGLDLMIALAIAVHPAAFYLVTGYSESLFLLALVGFIYWTGRRGAGSGVLAAAHGFVLSATRIVGLPLAFYPLVHTCVTELGKRPGGLREKLSHCVRPAVITSMALLGGLAFFGYCQWRFGEWNLYLETQKAGWGIEPDYLIVLRLQIYRVFLPAIVDGVPEPHQLSQLAIPATMAYFLGLVFIDWRLTRRFPDSGWRQRVGFYVAAWIMFYLSVCGLKNRAMASMLRYTLSVHLMLVLAAVHMLLHVPPPRGRWRALAAAGLILLAMGSTALQTVLAAQYTHDRWVA